MSRESVYNVMLDDLIERLANITCLVLNLAIKQGNGEQMLAAITESNKELYDYLVAEVEKESSECN